ncbi:hypothetical protein [Neobacillus vireti]|uniref:hypothetical protein n=1 Tax=Neobacillus vireti TaxID=220686 RepID=UPI002FFEAB3F
MAKLPLALKYTSFYKQLPTEWHGYFNTCTVSEKPEALKMLATIILKEHDFSRITEALTLVSEQVHPYIESIKQVFYQLINGWGGSFGNTPKIP